MAEYFGQLAGVLLKHGSPPLFYAGDIFHKWNSPPELINFLLRYLPTGYAIPGNHDLPYHNYADRKKSAYWTLVQAGKLVDMKPGQWVHVEGISVRAYPFGSDPEDCPGDRPMYFRDPGRKQGPRIALIHAYCWKDGHAFPGVSQEQHIQSWWDRLRHYDGLIFGDNHQAFTHQGNRPWVRNGGCFIRQSQAEMDVRPSVGLIWSDGSLTEERLDCTGDLFHPPDQEPEEKDVAADMADLMVELATVGKSREDFRAAVKRVVDQRGVSPAVRRLILDYMGEGKS